MELPNNCFTPCNSNDYNPREQTPVLSSQTSKIITMKSFLIMVAAVVVGVIVAGYVSKAIAKKTA